MNLSNLPLLASGQIPENDLQYKELNEARKKRVAGFVKSIPQKYSIEEIQSDVEKLSQYKDSPIYKFVDKFNVVFVTVAILLFVLYWILFGFGYGLLTGGGVLILLAFLDKRLGNLFEMNPSSIQLLTDFDTLVNNLYNAQRREQKRAR